MADNIKVYHNPRCSKSRMALSYLSEKGLNFKVIEYLKENPSKSELSNLIKELGISPNDLVRKGEEEYKSLKNKESFTDEDWINAMTVYPKLIERPIVVKNGKAVVARPTEKIDEIL